ncbi:hypothetical protein QTO34_018292 [Cnephaeus nilssonii]|uniref:Uncharacterized protein n=1 Tax=Cnephaeus nilssonii TaxID=3371016 RepID=A0AA40LMY3_CNENI|nr:hypothetical protein QTO34_018292 [Eptesicus nilssonii]
MGRCSGRGAQSVIETASSSGGPFAVEIFLQKLSCCWVGLSVELECDCSPSDSLSGSAEVPGALKHLLNPAAIYANNEIRLHDVEAYGFNYDYTMTQYADSLHPEVFSAAWDILIEHYKYPEGIRKCDYNPSFAIRGLHYDIQKSLLMKIDPFHYVQLGTA